MNPLRRTRHYRRSRWVVSGAFWMVLVLADLAIVSFWAVVGIIVLTLFGAGGVALRRRRLLAAGASSLVVSPSGTPLEAAPTGVTPVAPPMPAEAAPPASAPAASAPTEAPATEAPAPSASAAAPAALPEEPTAPA